MSLLLIEARAEEAVADTAIRVRDERHLPSQLRGGCGRKAACCLRSLAVTLEVVLPRDTWETLCWAMKEAGYQG